MEAKHIQSSQATILDINNGVQAKVLLRSSDTNGKIAVFEDVVDAGAPGSPRHIHHKQDETFFFLEGEFEVEIDGKRYQAKPGDTVFVPRGTPHAWKFSGTEIDCIRYIFSPALNIEDMFQDLHDLRSREISNQEQLEVIAQRYPDQEMLGPPIS